MKAGDGVLLIEDSESDVFFLRQALSKSGVDFPLQVVTDGMEAIAYLEGAGAYSDRSKFPLPSLILLDLKLPKKSGLEILEWLKSRTNLRKIPVFVLSSSNEGGDIRSAYALGAALYIVKPMGFEKLRGLVQGISRFMADADGKPEKYLSDFCTPRPKAS